jgi:hypothetical protein
MLATNRHGTVEHHGSIDIRELIRRRTFDHPVGTVWRCALQWPWITTIKLNQMSIELELRAGRTEVVPLAWARCGATGKRMRLVCPYCRRCVCKLYEVDWTCCCRTCGALWYACQRRSANGRRCLRAQKLRLNLGGGASLQSLDAFPPRPRGMRHRTYERYRCHDLWATRKLNRFQWRDPDYSVLVPR